MIDIREYIFDELVKMILEFIFSFQIKDKRRNDMSHMDRDNQWLRKQKIQQTNLIFTGHI